MKSALEAGLHPVVEPQPRNTAGRDERRCNRVSSRLVTAACCSHGTLQHRAEVAVKQAVDTVPYPKSDRHMPVGNVRYFQPPAVMQSRC